MALYQMPTEMNQTTRFVAVHIFLHEESARWKKTFHLRVKI